MDCRLVPAHLIEADEARPPRRSPCHIPGKMIKTTAQYAKELGYQEVYIMSGEHFLFNVTFVNKSTFCVTLTCILRIFLYNGFMKSEGVKP